MDGNRHQELTDETLEKDIEAALGVDPSPEFLPKVRASIANERMREGWLASGPWRWASALVGVTVVVVAGLWIMRGPATSGETAHDETSPVVESIPAAPAVVQAAPEPATPVVIPVVNRERSPQRRVAASPEVVISPDDAAALRHLLVAIAARQVEALDIPNLGAESAPLPPIEEIVLEPIKLSPLAGLESE